MVTGRGGSGRASLQPSERYRIDAQLVPRRTKATRKDDRRSMLSRRIIPCDATQSTRLTSSALGVVVADANHLRARRAIADAAAVLGGENCDRFHHLTDHRNRAEEE